MPLELSEKKPLKEMKDAEINGVCEMNLQPPVVVVVVMGRRAYNYYSYYA